MVAYLPLLYDCVLLCVRVCVRTGREYALSFSSWGSPWCGGNDLRHSGVQRARPASSFFALACSCDTSGYVCASSGVLIRGAHLPLPFPFQPARSLDGAPDAVGAQSNMPKPRSRQGQKCFSPHLKCRNLLIFFFFWLILNKFIIFFSFVMCVYFTYCLLVGFVGIGNMHYTDIAHTHAPPPNSHHLECILCKPPDVAAPQLSRSRVRVRVYRSTSATRPHHQPALKSKMASLNHPNSPNTWSFKLCWWVDNTLYTTSTYINPCAGW